jgi:hypothetical protein
VSFILVRKGIKSKVENFIKYINDLQVTAVTRHC